MTTNVTPGYCYCSRVKQNVSIARTEGQCRDEHSCNGDVCPLEKEFAKSNRPGVFETLANGFCGAFTRG